MVVVQNGESPDFRSPEVGRYADLSEKSNSAANQNDREEFLASGKLRLPSGVSHPQVM